MKTIDSECWNTARRFANQPELALPRLGFGFSSALDGNLTQDGLWTYEWNADEVRSTEMAKPRRGEKRRVPYGRSDEQNRLIAIESRTDLPATVTRQRLEFAYDSRSRRIQKRVKEYNSGSSSWTTTAQIRFLYDGWNLLAEYDVLNSDALIRSHVWGLDLSGTPQGVGGVGGLLWSSQASNAFAPGFDANGNIITWIDLSDGSLAGTAEYGAFGETLVLRGVSAQLPFGFSTKYEDTETELLYYGYRYYAPSSGRWLAKDPIMERGGLNLYGMLNNDLLNAVDLFGLQGRSTRCKPKSGFDLEFKDFQNVSVTLDDTNAEPPEVMTGVPGDLFDVYFRVRGNAKVKVSCHRTKRDSDGCCRTTKASLTVGPFNFDETISQRVSLFNPVTGWRALNLARWAARIAGNIENIPKIKAALEAKAKADGVCKKILK